MRENGREADSYVRYAAVFVAVTVLSGVWLRTGMLRPEALAGFSFRNLVHAHSHVAFFGWVTMAAFALLLRSLGSAGSGAPGWLRWHANLMGVASAAAFLGFLRSGYAPETIALSALHVALWVVFTIGVWSRLARGERPEHAFFRVALGFLVLAGAGTIGTGILSARASDPWLSRLAIELFLTPFVGGWLVLAAFGVAYARLPHSRHSRLVLLLAAAGVLPSGLLHITAPPPLPWLTPLGHAGMLLSSAGTLLFALDVIRERVTSPFLRLAGGAALIKGLAELAVGAGIADHLVGSDPLVIAYLHLVLLGMVTSILADGLFGQVRLTAPAVLHAVGLVVQLGALAALGWAPLFHLSSALGWSTARLLTLALLGGILSAAALLTVSARLLFHRALRAPSPGRPLSAL